MFSRHFQQYFSYIVADLLLHDSVLYGEHCQYSNSHYQTLFITFELISSQTVLNSNRSIMSIPDEQTIEDTKRVIKNGSRSKSSTVPQLYPVELTLADLKEGYLQTITELNVYTHPTHVDRNQHDKTDAIIVTTWDASPEVARVHQLVHFVNRKGIL